MPTPLPGFDPTSVCRDISTALAIVDQWVAGRGNGAYVAEQLDTIPGRYELFPQYGIQQVRSELERFMHEIVRRGLGGTALEVGLGHYGSTHFVWRLLFERVVTVEYSPERVRAFVEEYQKFSGHWGGSDGRSSFVYGSSGDPKTVWKAFDAVGGPVDMLFIDGDHSYAAVMCDWLLYHKLVRRGGLVAFHDVATGAAYVSEAGEFVKRLESGGVDGCTYDFTRIIQTPNSGIGFYEVP